MALGKQIRKYRLHLGWTLEQLEEKSGVPKGTISALEMRDSTRSSFAPALAAAFGLTLEQLLDEPSNWLEQNQHNIEPAPDIQGQVPVISWVTAGKWAEVIDIYEPGVADEWLPCIKKHTGRTFALRVKGMSMYNPMGKHTYSDGDIIFVDPEKEAINGARVVVRLEDSKEATFKQLVIEGEKKYLMALNPSWPEKFIEINGNATICGVVIGKWTEE
ncbi:MAG: XRE family transcriptional regulator [Oxalobacter formigenes]|nr:XRE family transcriptional regulator [Oxalobacter formigenes]